MAIMSFNASLGIDFSNWTEPKLEREENQVQLRNDKEELPKLSEGSKDGRENHKITRRKRYGGSKKCKTEDQPWILQFGGEDGKKLRGKLISSSIM